MYNGKPDIPILSPETIQLNTNYAITINPCDDYQFFKEETGDSRITKSNNHITYLIRNNPNYIFDLHLEVSRKGRIHYHGTLSFTHTNHIRNFYLEFIPKLLLSHHIEIDTISDPKKWEDYCKKSKILFNYNLKTTDIIKVKKPNNKLYKPIDDY